MLCQTNFDVVSTSNVLKLKMKHPLSSSAEHLLIWWNCWRILINFTVNQVFRKTVIRMAVKAVQPTITIHIKYSPISIVSVEVWCESTADEKKKIARNLWIISSSFKESKGVNAGCEELHCREMERTFPTTRVFFCALIYTFIVRIYSRLQQLLGKAEKSLPLHSCRRFSSPSFTTTSLR